MLICCHKKRMTHPLGDTHPAQLLPITLYFVVRRNTENTLDDYISIGNDKSSYAEDGHKVNGPGIRSKMLAQV